ncbi:AraC family transcriptional regulator [Paenibacillus sp. WLX1005]|uniref:AraC family transcriptional regulator n=1 Tax=Paenibacillus sp. WLX1005 TaxID=3243766 RepID=UPI003984448F
MNNFHSTGFSPPREQLADYIQQWTRASISLIDIRHEWLHGQQENTNHLAPASLFLFSYGGAADIQLNGTGYSIDRFGFFHAGKGSSFSVRAGDVGTGLYTLLYRAEPKSVLDKHLKSRHDATPFRECYGFEPDDPLFFAEHLHRMWERWAGGKPLDMLYSKAALHQLVYKVYEQLERGDVRRLQPDAVSLARHYMDTHYHESVSLRRIAQYVHVSASNLSRLFRKQQGMSPQEYLIRKRLSAAEQFLRTTDANLREIAYRCGFSDEFHLIKTFKSVRGITPGDYRKLHTIQMHDSAMLLPTSIPYAGQRPVQPDHETTEGEYAMFTATKGKMMLALLGLTLILSACAPATTPVSGNTSTTSSNPNEASATSTAAVTTHEFKHAGGTSTVPVQPKRIVTDWFYGELLTLGVRPIGYPEYLLSEYPYVKSDGTEALGDSLEQVVDLNPDLIISTWDESYDQYAKIAPSVLLKTTMPLKERMQKLGELVGKEEEAQKWSTAFDTKLKQAKTNLHEKMAPNTTVTILSIFQKNLQVYGYRNMGGEVLYKMLEVQPPQAVQKLFVNSDKWNANVSFESLPDLAGTDIILTVYDPEGTGRQKLQELQQSTVWKNLDAVKNGRVHVVDYYDLFYEDPIAVDNQIKMLSDLLTQ